MKQRTPWGTCEVLAEGHLYKVKRLTIRPGNRISLQRHLRRDEFFTAVSGFGWATLGDDKNATVGRELFAGAAVGVRRGVKHRLENKGKTDDLVIIEVQCGDYVGEDDIERFEDDFGRV